MKLKLSSLAAKPQAVSQPHSKALNLLYSNIQGIENSREQIVNLLNLNYHNISHKWVDIWAQTETWAITPPNKINNYTYLGVNAYRDKKGGRPCSGLGFWVHKHLINKCTLINSPAPHRDIAWLQIMAAITPTYIGLVYSRPNEMANHTAVIESLSKTLPILSQLGRCVIVGDFNANIHEWTGGKPAPPSTYEHELLSLISSHELQVHTNPQQIRENVHWTYEAPHHDNTTNLEWGKSIPDLLISKLKGDYVTGYRVLPHCDIGHSYHKAFTFQITIGPPIQEVDWGIPDRSRAIWNEKTKAKYKGEITQYLLEKRNDIPTSMTSIEEINTAAEIIQITMQKAIKSITPNKIMKRKKCNESERNTTIAELISQKEKILARKRINKGGWDELHRLQRQIVTISREAYTKKCKVWWDKLSESHGKRATKEFWQTAKNLRAEADTTFPECLTDENESIVMGKQAILNHIEEYYKDISECKDKEALDFYRLNPHNTANDTEIPTTGTKRKRKERRDRNPVTMKTVKRAIDSLENGVSPGIDDVTSECLKQAPLELLQLLTKTLSAMWAKGHTPPSWQYAMTKLLHKGAERTKIKNYRPITILTTLLKVWEKVIEREIRSTVDEGGKLSSLQIGTKRGSTQEMALLATNILLEHSRQSHSHVYLAHLDLSKAYNRVRRGILWEDMKKLGVPASAIKAAQSTYSHYKERIHIGNTYSRWYTPRNGLRQGSVLSPILFIVYVNDILCELEATQTGVGGKPYRTPALMYVDDLQLLAASLTELEIQIQIVTNAALRKGLVLAKSKTKLLSNKKPSTLTREILYSNLPMTTETPATSVYLGVVVNPRSSTGGDHITYRLGKAYAALAVMRRRGLRAGAINRAPALHILKAVILPTLLYGLETLQISESEWARLKYHTARMVAETVGLESSLTTPEQSWILAENDILDPKDQTRITRLQLYNKIMTGRANSLTRHLLRCQKNNFFSTLVKEDKTSLPRDIQRKLEETPLTSTARKNIKTTLKMSQRMACLSVRSGVCFPPCVVATQELTQRDYNLYMRERAKIFTNMEAPLPELCTLCRLGEIGDLHHIINKCEFPPTRQNRRRMGSVLDLLIPQLEWNTLTPTEKTATILDPPNDLSAEQLQLLTQEAVIALRIPLAALERSGENTELRSE